MDWKTSHIQFMSFREEVIFRTIPEAEKNMSQMSINYTTQLGTKLRGAHDILNEIKEHYREAWETITFNNINK